MFSQTQTLSPNYWESLNEHWKHAIFEAAGGREVIDAGFLYYINQIESLDLYGTGITDLSPLMLFPNLRVLDISGTPIQDLSALCFVPHLEVLHAAYGSSFSLSDLLYCPKLERLDLSYPSAPHTSWQSLDQLPNLSELFLNCTGISSVVDLLMLEKLQVLSASFNPISNTEKAYLRELLPHAQLIF
ncbi:MAG: leucine-rich repeat domain-containing protein [Bacteroidota bacterium]